MASFSASSSGLTSITCRVSGLSTVSYDRMFTVTCGSKSSTFYRYGGETPGSWSHTFTGLRECTTYECDVECENIDSGWIVWSASDSATTDCPVEELRIHTPTASSASIVSGQDLYISWTYSGVPTSRYWYLLGSEGTDRSRATILNSRLVSSGDAPFGGQWTPTGIWNFWIVCADSNPQTSGIVSSSYCTVTITSPPTGRAVAIFDGTDWIETAVPYIFDGTDWIELTYNIFDGDWL